MPDILLPATIIDLAPMGELILNAGGFPVAWYPVDAEGRTKADVHPLGEGLVKDKVVRRGDRDILFKAFRRVRCRQSAAETYWTYTEDGLHVPVKRIIPAAMDKHLLSLAASENVALLRNVLDERFLDVADIEEPTTYDALKAWVKALDDFQNTLFTIGTAGDYAGYNAMIAGGVMSSGDAGQELDGGDYNENVVDNGLDGIQLITAGSRPRIWSAVGGSAVLFVNGNASWFVDNCDLDGQGAASVGLYLANGGGSLGSRLLIHGSSYGVLMTGVGDAVANCRVYDNGIEGIRLGTGCRAIHNTVVDNTTFGITSAAAGDRTVHGNIAVGNGTDYNNINAIAAAWNAAGAGVPGVGGQDSFLTSYFEDYAADDFRINATGQAWLAARFKGWPLVADDYLGNTRKKSVSSPVFYPGAHDPDPQGSTAPTFAPATAVVDRGDGTVAVTFAKASANVVNYHVAVHTAAINSAALDAGTYDVNQVDDDGSATYTVIVGTTAKGAALLTAGTVYYFAVSAWNGATRDTGSDNASATPTDPNGQGGVAYVLRSIAPVQLAATETTIHTCPSGKRDVVRIALANTHSSALTSTLHLVRSGDAAGADVAQTETYHLAEAGSTSDESDGYWGPFTLEPGDVISGLASVAAKVTATVQSCVEQTL